MIREVEPQDYDALAHLIVDVYAAELGEMLSDDYRVHLADVARRAEGSVVLVAVEEGDLVGSITYVPGPESDYAEFEWADEAGIRMLVVAPHAQRRGIGSALVNECIRRARRAGKSRVSLHTTPSMKAAQRLYERLGFVRAPDRDWVPEPGVELIGYVLTLELGLEASAGVSGR